MASWSDEEALLVSDTEQLSICIPAFDEEAGIGESLAAVREAFPSAEILVVNDGSKDHTAELARAVPGVHVITHERNRGYGASLKSAMRKASRDVIAWYDADGEHTAEDLKKVIAPRW